MNRPDPSTATCPAEYVVVEQSAWSSVSSPEMIVMIAGPGWQMPATLTA